MTIPATVLHPGYVLEEIIRETGRSRYLELAMALTEWHDLPGHDCEDPPDEVVAMLRELKEMKLGAFARAGRRYRTALDAYEQRRELERTLRRAGWPIEPDTAIQYVDGPKEPIVIDFTYPA